MQVVRERKKSQIQEYVKEDLETANSSQIPQDA